METQNRRHFCSESKNSTFLDETVLLPKTIYLALNSMELQMFLLLYHLLLDQEMDEISVEVQLPGETVELTKAESVKRIR